MANRADVKAKVQAYIQDLIDARHPSYWFGNAEHLAEAIMSTIDDGI